VRSEARTRLRAATAPAHAEVDRIFSRFDLSNPSDYRAFLVAHAGALFPVETWLETCAPDVVADWPARRRTHQLTTDLAALGEALPLTIPFEAAASPAGIIGVLYVVEGSRLGGRVLARRLAPGLPATYLSPSADSPSWPALLQRLDDILVDAAAEEIAVAAALQTFARFAQAGELALGCPA
jgi:heme oxygenase